MKTFSRHDHRASRADGVYAAAARAARLPGPQRNPYQPGTRNYYTWRDAYRAAVREQQPRPSPRRRPDPASRQRAGAALQRLSQVAAALCRNPAFQQWLGVADEDAAAARVRELCAVASRRELDTSPTSARLFHDRVRRPFAASRES